MSISRGASDGSEFSDSIPLERNSSNISNGSYIYEEDDDDDYHEYEDYNQDEYGNDDDDEDDDHSMQIANEEVKINPQGSPHGGGSPEKAGSYSDKMRTGETGVRVVDYTEVESIMASLIGEVTNLLNVSDDIARILLCHFKWNKERLVDSYYSDSDELLVKVGAQAKPEDVAIFPEGMFTCPICADEALPSEMVGLGCNHLVCKTCWGCYLNGKIGEGPSCVRTNCPMFKCSQIVPCSVFNNVCAPVEKDKFRVFMTRNFIEFSKSFKWCPSAGCEKVAIASAGVTTVRCDCGAAFCFKCGEESHEPVQCSYLTEWSEKCSNESETANWILAHTKKCVKCNARIEKNQGCNHMTCKICKYDFCWICMGPWADHGQGTGGFYKCNKYEAGVVDESATDADKAKVELDRYLHYYQRYIAHDRSLKHASGYREEAERRMVELQESGKSAWIDVQFLKQAVEQVIECRRVLKYTYVLGYFLKDLTQEKRLFEHHQEMLEKHTETLHHYTEMSLDNLDRTQVVNLTRVAEKFMSSLLTSLNS